MALINTGSFSKALWPGVNAWYGKAYDEYPVEWTDLFNKYTSRKAFEEDVGISSFGLAAVKPEGQGINFDTETQGFITRYTHINYGLGFIVTKEAFEDDQYDVIAERRARGLAYSMRQTKELVAANVYNRAFNTSYTFGDGKAMCVSNHPNVAGGTQSNILTVAANLSEASLEQATIDISRWLNDRGLRIQVMPMSLHIPPELMFEAERILKSQYRVGTANNDISALVSMGKFPNGIKVNHYFSSTTAWFLRTNAPDGLKYFERRADTFTEDNDFDTENAKFKATSRYSFGVTDYRGIYGTPGV
jgi:phage major head subunit gpT-like protein